MQLGKEINLALEQADLSRLIGKSVSRKTLIKIFNDIAHPFDTKVRLNTTTSYVQKLLKTRKRICYISGEYIYGEHATVFFHMNPTTKVVTLSRKELNRLIFLFSQTIQHEHIHRNQYMKRRGSNMKNIAVPYSETSFKKFSEDRKENIIYYASGEEIVPHAHDLAMEMVQYYPQIPLKKLLSGIRLNLTTLSSYRKTYKGLEWEPLRKALLKKTWYWLPTIIPVFQL